jgi:hypothetical protein
MFVKEWIPLSGHGRFSLSRFVLMEISMSTRPIIKLTPVEYLQLDRHSDVPESIASQLTVEPIYLKVALDLSGSAEYEG